MALYLINSATAGSDKSLSWPKVLMQQHIQLKEKIENIKKLAANENVCFFNLDAKLKQLTMALKIHLQLEQHFLGDVLAKEQISVSQKNNLKRGYYALYKACEIALKLSRTAILSRNCTTTSQNNIQKLIGFLNEIEARLNEEDIVYSMTYQGEAQCLNSI